MLLDYEGDLPPRREDHLWKTIGDIKTTLGLNTAEIAEKFHIGRRTFEAFETKKKIPDIHSAQAFCDDLGISFKQLMRNNIDLTALKQHQKGNSLYVPERYRRLAVTGVSNANVVLDYISQVHSPKITKEILKYLQMKQEVLKEDLLVNVNLLSDIFNFIQLHSAETFISLGKFRIAQDDFKEFGETHSLSEFIFSGIQSLHSFYKRYVEALRADTAEKSSWRFDISFKDNEEIIFKVFEKKENCFAFSKQNYSNSFLCYYRLGMLKSLPALAGMPEPVVLKKSCIHSGAQSCDYYISLPLH